MPPLNYSEGTCFAVPLRAGGCALGVVARMDGDGRVFGYFFGPKVACPSDLTMEDERNPATAILRGRFGDLGIINGDWPIVGSIRSWSRERWPLPLFTSNADKPNAVALTEYDDMLAPKSYTTVKHADLEKYDVLPDSMMGYGAVEIVLTKLLSGIS